MLNVVDQRRRKGPRRPCAGWPPPPQKGYRIVTFVMGSFGLYVLLIEGSAVGDLRVICLIIIGEGERLSSRAGSPTPPLAMSLVNSKGKGKVQPRTGHEGPEGEQRYSSSLSLTSGVDGVGGQSHAPAALKPVKETRYALYRRLGGLQGRPGRVRKTRPHRDSIPGPSST